MKRKSARIDKNCSCARDCDKGDILSPMRPYEVLDRCDKYPDKCVGGTRYKKEKRS